MLGHYSTTAKIGGLLAKLLLNAMFLLPGQSGLHGLVPLGPAWCDRLRSSHIAMLPSVLYALSLLGIGLGCSDTRWA